MHSIETWWGDLDFTEQTFWATAVVFSVLTFIQFVLGLFGLDFDGELEGNQTIRRSSERKSKEAFKLFSARNTIIFFTFFAWAGIVLLQKIEQLILVLSISAIIGGIGMLVLGYALYWFSKLSRNEQLDLYEVLFKTAEVRNTVPANQQGHGKITFKQGKSVREINAITDHLTSLPNGSNVRIVDVVDNSLVIVEPYS